MNFHFIYDAILIPRMQLDFEKIAPDLPDLNYLCIDGYCCIYRPFNKTLPRSSAFVNWISVRFYETDLSYL